MLRRIGAFVLLVALGSGALIGGGLAGAARASEVSVDIVFAPAPPPVAPVEVIGVAPGPGYVWIAGHYAWHGRWVWIGGYWERVPRGYAVWVPGHWDRRAGGWVWVEGHWR